MRLREKAFKLTDCDPSEFTEDINRQHKRVSEEIMSIEREILSLEKNAYVSGVAQSINDRIPSKDDGNCYLAQMARAVKYGPDAKGLSDEIRAITSTSGSAAIQDPNVMDQVIYELQSSNELAQAGVQFQNTENYKLVPKVTAYPTVYWQTAESQQITLDAAMTIGSVKWELKDGAVRVRVTNQYLMDSSERGQRIVQEAMRRAIQQAIGQAIFTGSGSNGEPKGIQSFDNVQTLAVYGGGGAALDDWSQISTGVKMLADINVPISNISVFTSPSAWLQLASLEATDGQPLLMPPALNSIRFFGPTTFIPATYNSNTWTKIFMGDFSKIIVGMGGTFEIILNQTRADYLETEFLVHFRMDVQATHDNNFVELTEILLP